MEGNTTEVPNERLILDKQPETNSFFCNRQVDHNFDESCFEKSAHAFD
jgi:hypothetical protein